MGTVDARTLKQGDIVRAEFDVCALALSGSTDKATNEKFWKWKGVADEGIAVFEVGRGATFNSAGSLTYWPTITINYNRSVDGSTWGNWATVNFQIDNTNGRKVSEVTRDELKRLKVLKEYLFEMPFNYTLNRGCWTPQLEQQMVQKAVESACSRVRMSLREWPFGKKLAFDLKKERDFIGFYWEDDRGVRK